MNKSRSASDILLAGIPEEKRENSTSARTRQKYLNDIARVRDSVVGIITLISGISQLVTPAIRKTNDKILAEYIGILVDKTKLIQSRVTVLDNSLAELKQIEDDERFMVTSFSVIEIATAALDETQIGYVDVYEKAVQRIEDLKPKKGNEK